VPFEVLGEITEKLTIRRWPGIRELRWLRRAYDPGRSRKMKDIAKIRLPMGTARAEVHWYEGRMVSGKAN